MSKLLTIKNQINSRGLANGWHAQELFRRATKYRTTMALLFRQSIEDSCAYVVPATLEILTRQRAVYRFLDNSIIELLPPNSVLVTSTKF